MNRLLLLLLLVFLGCAKFDRNYDQVDKDMVRVIDFSFENPDLAPGDTAVMYTIFAGKKITPADIRWSVSWDISGSQYAGEVASKEQELEGFFIQPVTMPDLVTEQNTQAFKVTFIIPKDVIRVSSRMDEDWSGQLNLDFGELLDSIGHKTIEPSAFGLPETKSEMIDTLEALAANHTLITPEGFNGSRIELASQILTTPFQINADITGSNRKMLRHSIRYHNKFEGVDGVFINEKPEIGEISIAKYKGSDITKSDIHKKSPLETEVVIGDTLSMKFDTDKYTYMMKVSLKKKDQSITLQKVFEAVSASKVGESSFEKYDAFLFLKEDNELFKFELYNNNLDDLAKDPEPNLYLKIKPKNNDVGPVTMWYKLFDARSGVMDRPRGSVVKELTIDVLK